MTETVTKNTAYLVNGPGDAVAAATKVTMYLVIDTNTIVDPGEAPVIERNPKWTARIARKAG